MREIVIEGPGKNALGSPVMHALLGELERAGGGPVLLTGKGDAFSAGLNLKEVARLDGAGMEAFLKTLEQLINALFTYPGPVVAAVNGHAIAGGCVLALCADHSVARADPDIRIGLNEVALGLEFPPGVFRMLRTQLAPERLNRAVLAAELVPPRRALELGLIAEVTEGDLLTVARERLAALAAHPPAAFAAAKRMLRGESTVHPEDGPAIKRMLASWTSLELRARVGAMLGGKG